MSDISNRTLAILIVAILVTSLLSTWLILSQKSYDVEWLPTDDAKRGKVMLFVGEIVEGELSQDGQVSMIVLPTSTGVQTGQTP